MVVAVDVEFASLTIQVVALNPGAAPVAEPVAGVAGTAKVKVEL